MAVNVEKCNRCPARNACIIACEPGSLLCMSNRMRSGKTHGDEIQEAHIRYCPHCGRPINCIFYKGCEDCALADTAYCKISV